MGVRVLIVDDHPGFRAQARKLLEREGCMVIGEAPDCASAIKVARSLVPEIALVDVFLPDGDGFALTEQLLELPSPPVVVLTSSRDESELQPCISESGARGFVAKAELSREAIEEVVG